MSCRKAQLTLRFHPDVPYGMRVAELIAFVEDRKASLNAKEKRDLERISLIEGFWDTL